MQNIIFFQFQCSSDLKCCNFLSCEKNVCEDRSVFINGTETLGYNKTTELDTRFDEESSSAQPVEPGKCSELGEKVSDFKNFKAWVPHWVPIILTHNCSKAFITYYVKPKIGIFTQPSVSPS